MRVKYISVLLLVVIILIISSLSLVFGLTSPSGARVYPQNNSTAPPDAPGSLSAFAGNVTQTNMYGFSTTQSWQGYYGNVTGVIELTDYLNNTMYNWSQANPRGEVYAANMSSIIWSHIQCFNFTANGSLCTTGDFMNNGSMSVCGMNESQLEEQYTINYTSDVDGVNETFNRRDHALFYTNNIEFAAGDCSNTKLYNTTGLYWDETLLWSPESTAVVFASRIYQDDEGFDGSTYDFQMMVLEDGHGIDLDITPYYFWLELE